MIEQNWQKDSIAVIYPNYIQKTIKYYWKDLPSPSIIAIEPGTNIEQVNSQLNKLNNLKNIFLIVRVELGIQKDLENFNQKISLITSKFKKPLAIQEFLIISNGFQKVDKDSETLKKLLAIQQSRFGKIVSYDDFNSYILAKYNL